MVKILLYACYKLFQNSASDYSKRYGRISSALEIASYILGAQISIFIVLFLKSGFSPLTFQIYHAIIVFLLVFVLLDIILNKKYGTGIKWNEQVKELRKNEWLNNTGQAFAFLLLIGTIACSITAALRNSIWWALLMPIALVIYTKLMQYFAKNKKLDN